MDAHKTKATPVNLSILSLLDRPHIMIHEVAGIRSPCRKNSLEVRWRLAVR